MVHIGSAPPELEEVLTRMEKGDVLTHCFNGKPNGIFRPSHGSNQRLLFGMRIKKALSLISVMEQTALISTLLKLP